MSEGTDKARDEFFSEAQELIEAFSRTLLTLDELESSGAEHAAVVNEAFRCVHTLKSLAGIFGAKPMAALSHRLEDVLDDLRLGRVPLTRELLDALFQSIDLFLRIMKFEREGESADAPSIEPLMARLATTRVSAVPQTVSESHEIEASLLAVLTEYEEHRLRTAMAQGLNLFKVRVTFELETIDTELEALKAKAKPLGEVITYLPTGESTSIDKIGLDLLIAGSASTEEVRAELGSPNIGVIQIPRRAAVSEHAMTPLPSDAGETTALGPLQVSLSSVTDVPPVVGSRAPEASSVAPEMIMRSVSQTVRVDIRKLDALMNVVGELAIVKSSLSQIGERVRSEGHRQLGSELYRLHRNFDRRLGELLDGVLEVRMVPLSQVFDRLTRVVRQISRNVDKEIRLVITGGETEIDKLIVEELSDPLMHIVRNSIDHGIEDASHRLAIGKTEAGTIALNAFQKGNHVVLEVEDDGGGVDEASLVERAVLSGQTTHDEARGLTRSEVLNLVFLPGVSTRQAATDYSGRGVGMDVVKTNIGKLGGVIDLQSECNIGTKITVTLPITLAIVSALLIRSSGQTFAVPLTSVSEALLFDESMTKRVDSREMMTLRGVTLPLCRVDRHFELTVNPQRIGRRFVVVLSMGSRRLGLVVDELLGQQDIVIKTLGRSLRAVHGFSGATELGDQRVALVLDVASIIDEVIGGLDARTMRGRELV